jgi:hypothetical protein
VVEAVEAATHKVQEVLLLLLLEEQEREQEQEQELSVVDEVEVQLLQEALVQEHWHEEVA